MNTSCQTRDMPRAACKALPRLAPIARSSHYVIVPRADSFFSFHTSSPLCVLRSCISRRPASGSSRLNSNSIHHRLKQKKKIIISGIGLVYQYSYSCSLSNLFVAADIVSFIFVTRRLSKYRHAIRVFSRGVTHKEKSPRVYVHRDARDESQRTPFEA